MEKIERILKRYKTFFNKEPVKYKEILSGVSDKRVLRIFSGINNVIGVYNSNIKENSAFIGFTKVFSKLGLNVPEIFHFSEDKKIYFLSDMGEKTLFECLKDFKDRKDLICIYKNVIEHLVKFQVYGGKNLNFDLCYETKFFNKEQIEFDIHKFKTYFLKRYLNDSSNIPDKHTLKEIIDKTINISDNYFMYRDFQPRNIIYNSGDLYFLDYQSGRLGPPQYDLISFLYSGSIDITPDERKLLSDFYFDEFSKYEYSDKNTFLNSLDNFALMRIIQVLGSYCYAYFEKNNTGVLSKIPTAIENLKSLKLNNRLNKFRKHILDIYSIHISVHQ